MTCIYLVRHGAAGDRDRWDGPDWLRPLTSRGHAQARGLLQLLAGAEIARVVSSPYVRCSETVVPIAAVWHLPIELDDALAEEADVEATFALMKRVAEGGAVLCSHGDMIPAVLDRLRASGVDMGAGRCEKGSVWALETHGGTVTSARYLAPLEA
jgi:phosphohistidine phosphatase SixA